MPRAPKKRCECCWKRPAKVTNGDGSRCYECVDRLRDAHERTRRDYVRRAAGRAFAKLAGVLAVADDYGDLNHARERAAGVDSILCALAEAEYLDSKLRAELHDAARWAMAAYFSAGEAIRDKLLGARSGATSDFVKKAAG